jgi:hypothetical protein
MSVIYPTIPFEDVDRILFLRRLDAAVAVDVTDWEAGFIEDLISQPRALTVAQRNAVDEMRKAYEGKI